MRERQFDKEIFEVAQEQRRRGLLSEFCSKEDMDQRFGKGRWRALRRHGIWQGQYRKDGSSKIRGIDAPISLSITQLRP